MYLVISYSYDMFGSDTICQYEISSSLYYLFDKYGPPTERHTEMIDNTEIDVFDLHYFMIPNDVFNLHDSYITMQKIEELIKVEKENQKLVDSDDVNLLKDYDSNDGDDEQSDIEPIEENEKSGLQKIIEQINDYRSKIYKALSERNKTHEPDYLVINNDLDAKENKKKYNKLKKIKNRLENRYENIMSTGTYHYLLFYFDKGIVQSYKRKEGVTSTIINGDELLYSFESPVDWAELSYILYHHKNAHLRLFNDMEHMVKYVDDIIGSNKEKYDNANIFFMKLISNKGSDVTLNIDNEIWLGTPNHKTIMSPSRLTHNRFFKELMKRSEGNRYNTINPVKESYHHIELECTQMVDKDEITLGELVKYGKYRLKHTRIDE